MATAAPPRPRMDPRMGQRRAAVARRRGRRRLALLLGALVLVAMAVAGWELLQSRLFSARVVSVTGAVHTTVPAVLAVSGLAAGPPLIDVNPGAVAARVETLPWVASATVVRAWPDGVHIIVTERVPVAVMARGHSDVLVDGSGRVLAPALAAPGLPVVAGPVSPPPPGLVVAAADQPGLVVAATLPPAFRAQVTGLTVAGGDVHLTLTSPVGVDLGPAVQLTEKYEAVAAYLAGGTLHPGDVIDVTVPGSPVVSGP